MFCISYTILYLAKHVYMSTSVSVVRKHFEIEKCLQKEIKTRNFSMVCSSVDTTDIDVYHVSYIDSTEINVYHVFNVDTTDIDVYHVCYVDKTDIYISVTCHM